MSSIDIAVLLVLAAFLLNGIRKGAFSEVFGLIGVFGGIAAGILLTAPLSEVLREYFDMPRLFAHILCFTAVFTSFYFLSKLLAGLLKSISEKLQLGWLNKVGGGAISMLKGAVIMSLVLMYASYLPIDDTLEKIEDKSSLYPYIYRIVPKLYQYIGDKDDLEDLPKHIRKMLKKGREKIIDEAIEDIKDEVEDTIDEKLR